MSANGPRLDSTIFAECRFYDSGFSVEKLMKAVQTRNRGGSFANSLSGFVRRPAPNA